MLLIVERVFGLLQDPVFWVSSIAGGFIVTVIGNYATRSFDRALSKRRIRQRRKLSVADAAVGAAAEHLLKHPGERFDLKLDVLFFSQRAIMLSALGVAFFVLAAAMMPLILTLPTIKWLVIGVLLIGLIVFTMFLTYVNREHRALKVLWEFNRRRNTKTYDDILDEYLASAVITDTESSTEHD